jgi:hypothetical protein
MIRTVIAIKLRSHIEFIRYIGAAFASLLLHAHPPEQFFHVREP